MELNVQKYLRSGKTVADLKEELGIKSSEYGDLVMLNYSQIDSPKTNPIVMECRQLVLEKDTWDIVYRSFSRFFNHGEVLNLNEDFDFANAVALDKIDGSIIGVFFYDGEWFMTTRGVIGGNCQVGTFPITFKELFDLAVMQYPDFWGTIESACKDGNDYCYIFELTAPENRVVTPYTDRALHLLSVRDRGNEFCELNRVHSESISKAMGVELPTMHSFSDISELVSMASNVGQLNEGFVCIDYSRTDENGNYRRIKVKNPAYLAIAHLKDSSVSSLRSLMQLVIMGEASEFLTYFPEFNKYVECLQEKWYKYRDQLNAELEEAETKKHLPRKDFALWAKDKINPSVLFQLLDGKITTVQDWISQMVEQKGSKNFGKNMMQILKINDIEWKTE